MSFQPNIPDSLLKNVNAELVKRFLIYNGYVLAGKKSDIAEAYRINDGDVVIVPLVGNSHEYPKLLMSLLEYLGCRMKLSVDDVLGLIVNPNCDIVRYMIKTEESKYGNLRAEEIKTATCGLYNVFYNSAQNVAKLIKRLKVRDSARGYADGCRFGQTEYGSFVLKIFCPTSDLGLKVENSEPYCREVTRGVAENFFFLLQNDIDNPEVLLPPAMSKKVALSIKEMYPAMPLIFSGGLSVRYSPLKEMDSNLFAKQEQAEVQEFEFKSNLFRQADVLYQRYCKAEEFERELMTGFITDLHKDPPVENDPLEKEISHKITMDLRFGASRRKVTTKLISADYKKAISWHDQSVEIVLDAKIDKRSKKWVVHEMYDLRPRDDSQNLLFDI